MIVTTDWGPYEEDLYILLLKDEGDCLVPLHTPQGNQLMDRLKKLPCFDMERLGAVWGSCEWAWFVCWKKLWRPPGDGGSDLLDA